MATVHLSFSPSPAHVRTARLVGVAVARRAGVADATLDEVRLAIGEACSRAVALHRRHALTDLIEVELQRRRPIHGTGDRPRARSTATSSRPPAPARPRPCASGRRPPSPADIDDAIDAIDEEDVAVGMGLTLLAGLVDDLSVRPATVRSRHRSAKCPGQPGRTR